MKDLLIKELGLLGYPVILQSSLGADERYPDSFFTFWNNETYDGEYYDNQEHHTVWDFDVNFYSTNPELVNTVLLEAKKILKKAGFVINGKGHDVGSDEPTHTGRGMQVLKIEKET